MIELLLGTYQPGGGAPPEGSTDWTSTAPASGGFQLNGNVANAPTQTTTSYAIFGPALPSQSWYFDVEISTGYSSYVAFLGIANGLHSGNWSQNYQDGNTATWYWSGSLYGAAAGAGSAPSQLLAGVYRFAFNVATKTLYMKRNSPSPSSIKSVALPGFTGTLRPFMCSQNGYPAPLVTTLYDIQLGSGGLY